MQKIKQNFRRNEFIAVMVMIFVLNVLRTKVIVPEYADAIFWAGHYMGVLAGSALVALMAESIVAYFRKTK